MKKVLLAVMLTGVSVDLFAADNCEQIKGQIEAKIKALGVQTYKLEVVDAAATVGGKEVGSCEGGKKKIVYWRL